MPAYFYVYPLPRRSLMRLAYYFDFDHADGREPDTYIGGAGAEVQKWWTARTQPGQPPPVLDAVEGDSDDVHVTDTRPCRVAPEHRLEGLDARIHSLCDHARTIAALARDTGTSPEELQPTLDDLVRRKLVLPIDGQYLSLAVMRRRRQPADAAGTTHVWIQLTATEASKPLPAAV
jgi:hypothetical protein